MEDEEFKWYLIGITTGWFITLMAGLLFITTYFNPK